MRAFNELQRKNLEQTSIFHAHITVIPKEGKDNTQCNNFRPISLLNSNAKLFTKILFTKIFSKRLFPYLETIIELDQVGFMPGRESRDGTTRAIDLIQKIGKDIKNCCLLAVNGEKAFDCINWKFMFQTLEVIGLGRNCIS